MFDEIFFHEICDRILHLLPITIDGQNHTDETECDHWPCSNIYTRCDAFWNCPSGEDEENCLKPMCPSRTLACVSSYNYKSSCLSVDRIENGITDCLGAPDEIHYCPATGAHQKRGRFRCFNDTKCVSTTALCNGRQDCLFGDDETFCLGYSKSCVNYLSSNIICQLEAQPKIFSLKTSSLYPLFKNQTIGRDYEWLEERTAISRSNIARVERPMSPMSCTRGRYVGIWFGGSIYDYGCFCPQNYYGDSCQYQNQRVSLTLSLIVIDKYAFYAAVVILFNDDDGRQEVNSFEQFDYTPDSSCATVQNIYLLYSQRPKMTSRNYSIRIDLFDKASITYIASWYIAVPLLFLPVNRLAIQLTIPTQSTSIPNDCIIQCCHGVCMKYMNAEKFFCRCVRGWEGAQCHIPVNCADCSSDSLCVSSKNNQSICVCPLNKYGWRCLLTYSCPVNFCKNNGQCIGKSDSLTQDTYSCKCSDQYSGDKCEKLNIKLEITLENIKTPLYLFLYYFSSSKQRFDLEHVILKKMAMFQRTLMIYTQKVRGFNMVFAKIESSYYLTLAQPETNMVSSISTSISLKQRCRSINELLNSTVLSLPPLRLVKYYHKPCQIHAELSCFVDESFMCLCTSERHANCFKFDHKKNHACQHNLHCLNGAKCLQNDPTCAANTICICTDCFFGDRCQFYAEGIGLTLDDILRYEIHPNTTISNQPLSIKISAALTMILFVCGLINSVLSLLAFQSKESRTVGCGMYLFASSITSFLSVSMCAVKFWFFILTQINTSVNYFLLRAGCLSIETALKLLLYSDAWFNACVAIERVISVLKGTNFDTAKSKCMARWIILLLPLFILGTIFHEPMFRELFEDKEEQCVWCVTSYPRSVQKYNTFILSFHLLAPFSANFISTVLIIIRVARRRAVIRTGQSYQQHLREQLNDNKHLVISSVSSFLLFCQCLVSLFH